MLICVGSMSMKDMLLFYKNDAKKPNILPKYANMIISVHESIRCFGKGRVKRYEEETDQLPGISCTYFCAFAVSGSICGELYCGSHASDPL